MRALAAFAVTAAALALNACSGGAGPAGTEPTTALDGVYTATSPGAFSWISFDPDRYFAFLRSDPGCDADMVPAGCVGVGTYVVDTASESLELHELQTGETYTYPLSITAGLAAGLVAALVTDGELVSGGSSQGSLVNNSGSPLTSAEGVSLTQNGASQSLVSSSGSPLVCSPSQGAQDMGSAADCSPSTSGGSKDLDGIDRHAAPTFGQMCRIGWTACKILLQASHPPTTLPLPELLRPSPPPITMSASPP